MTEVERPVFHCAECNRDFRSKSGRVFTQCPGCGSNQIAPVIPVGKTAEEVVPQKGAAIPSGAGVEQLVAEKLSDVEAAALEGFMAGYQNGYSKGYATGVERGIALAEAEFAASVSEEDDAEAL